MDSHIKTEVDFIINKYLVIEQKEYSINNASDRTYFYKRMSETMDKNVSKHNIFLPWSKLYEESLYLIFELIIFLKNQNKSHFPELLTINIFKKMNSIRILFISGYLESALIIYRTVIEMVQLELLSITDISESKKIIDYFDKPNEYWHTTISKGKLNNKIKLILDSIEGVDSSVICNNELHTILSNTAHASPLSCIPLEPDVLDKESLGHGLFGFTNYHLRSTYISMIQMIITFVNANIKLILCSRTWIKKSKQNAVALSKLCINYNSISRCFHEYYLPNYEKNEAIFD